MGWLVPNFHISFVTIYKYIRPHILVELPVKVPLCSNCRESESVKKKTRRQTAMQSKKTACDSCIPLHVDKDSGGPHVDKYIVRCQTIHIVVDYPDNTWIEEKLDKYRHPTLLLFPHARRFYLLDPAVFSVCPISHSLLNSTSQITVNRTNAATSSSDTRIMLGLDRSTSHAS